jgi:hypothetical protein
MSTVLALVDGLQTPNAPIKMDKVLRFFFFIFPCTIAQIVLQYFTLCVNLQYVER